MYQAEWCPFSAIVRQRLTELGQPFVAVPVPVEHADRTEMLEATGTDTIPALVFDDGTVMAGDASEIIAGLDDRYDEGPLAAEQRRAAIAHGSPTP